MLTLLTYAAHASPLSDSPFCAKAMCLLHASGQPWQAKVIGDPRKTPYGKLPTLLDGEIVIADSHNIGHHLATKYGTTFNKDLTEEQLTHSHTLIRMTEENLYFALLCDRWMNDANWAVTKEQFFSDLPWIMRQFLPNIIRKQVVAQAKAQGIGRLTSAERLANAKADVNAIQSTLANKPYLFGTSPTLADISIVPQLNSIRNLPVATELSTYVRTLTPLIDYLDRSMIEIYPSQIPVWSQ